MSRPEALPKIWRILFVIARAARTTASLKLRQMVYQPIARMRRVLPVIGRRSQTRRTNLLGAMRSAPTSETSSFRRFLPPDTAPLIEPSTLNFRILNIPHTFGTRVDWAFLNHGLLWHYHLHYLDWIRQPDLSDDSAVAFVRDYTQRAARTRGFRDPYPSSLRVMNMVKLAEERPALAGELAPRIAADTGHVLSCLEYHLMGNHLLENGFALASAGLFFHDASVFDRATRILYPQLKEQMLPDGAHFERSMSYHQLVVSRMIDTLALIDLIGANFTTRVLHLRQFIAKRLPRALGWLQTARINDQLGCMNDSVPDDNGRRRFLLQRAAELGICPDSTPLGESGLRVLRFGSGRALLDVGTVGPRYIPGHAHAGTVSFELSDPHGPVLVDTGVSTYDAGSRRSYERSTAAHNTVEIAHRSSSEVWGAFRVGRRARVRVLRDTDSEVEAEHDGYRHLRVIHRRKWQADPRCLTVTDVIDGPGASLPAVARYFAAPQLTVRREAAAIFLGSVTLQFNGAEKVDLVPRQVAVGFNQLRTTTCVEVHFRSRLVTTIEVPA